MFIHSVRVQNFRLFTDATFDFADDGRTLITGENGLGKSTILDALRLVLLGECRGVDGKGAGQRDQIQDGAEQAVITMRIEGLPEIRRTLSRGASAKQNIPPEAIHQKLGVTSGMMAAVLNGAAFFKAHHSEARDILFGALRVTVDAATIPDLEETGSLGLDDLDFRLKTWADKRRDAKRALADHRVPEAPKVVNIDQGVLARTDIDDLAASLKAMRTMLTESHREVARLEGERGEVRRRITEAESYGSLDALRARRDTYEELLEKSLKAQAKNKADRQAFDAEPSDDPKDVQREYDRIMALIDRIGSHDPSGGCVLDAKIPCFTQGQQFKGHVKALRESGVTLKKRIEGAQTRARLGVTLEQTKSDTADAVRENRAERDAAASRVTAAEKAAASLDSLRQRDVDLTAAIEVASKAATTAEQRVQGADELLVATREFKAGAGERAKASARKKELEMEVEICERVVEALGPTGARAAALQVAIGAFELELNKTLAGTEFTVRIQAEPWQVFVNDRRFIQLSKGQEIVVGQAFQDTLARISGLDFLAIDDAEAVVGKNRIAFTDIMMCSPVGQVIVAMARAANDKDPQIDGLQVIRLGRAVAAA